MIRTEILSFVVFSGFYRKMFGINNILDKVFENQIIRLSVEFTLKNVYFLHSY